MAEQDRPGTEGVACIRLQAVRRRVYQALHCDTRGDTAGTAVASVVLGLICASVLASILETVPSIAAGRAKVFDVVEAVSVLAFTAEYVLRLWSCTVSESYAGPISDRVKYALTPLMIVDLIALLPFYLPIVADLDLRFIRVLRLVRLVRLAKAARYVQALRLIGGVIRASREELVVSVFTILVLLTFASGVMYILERDAQPEAFGSIPAAMWWGAVTLTTVGYGDVYPITAAGKVCATAIALLSLGLFGLPAAILASGFIEALRAERHEPAVLICPHCGEKIEPR